MLSLTESWSVRARPRYITLLPTARFPHSCARARTVASEVFTEAQSFADCKLHIRTRLLASAFSNFWKTSIPVKTFLVGGISSSCSVVVRLNTSFALLPPSVLECDMAFITISGYPSSGKTQRAEQLKQRFERRLQDPSYDGPPLKVVIVSDDSLNLPRSVYNGEVGRS